MCGRFYIKGISRDAEEYFRRIFGTDFILPEDMQVIPQGPDFLPWNDIPAVINDSSPPRLTSMFWNLIPSYEPEFKPPKTWFNTRREKTDRTVPEQSLALQALCRSDKQILGKQKEVCPTDLPHQTDQWQISPKKGNL